MLRAKVEHIPHHITQIVEKRGAGAVRYQVLVKRNGGVFHIEMVDYGCLFWSTLDLGPNSKPLAGSSLIDPAISRGDRSRRETGGEARSTSYRDER